MKVVKNKRTADPLNRVPPGVCVVVEAKVSLSFGVG